MFKNKFNYPLFFEKRSPILISILGTIILFFQKHVTFCSISNFKEMLSSIINIAAVTIGFLLTIVSVLISLTGKKVIKRIQINNAMGIFASYFISPILSGFILIVFSTILIPFDRLSGNISHLLLMALFFNAAFFILSTIRIAILLLGILKQMSDEFEPQSDPKIKNKSNVYVPKDETFFKK